jgi:hypothetical protein
MFPLQKTLLEAYRDVFADFGLLVRAAAPWVLLPVLLSLVLEMLVSRQGRGVDDPSVGGGAVLLALVSANLLWALALSAVIVFWSRHLLLGERPDVLMAPINLRVLRYFGVGLLLAFAIGVPVTLFTFVVSTILAGPAGFAAVEAQAPLAGLLVLVAAAVVLARLHLVLPAIAIDDRRMTFGRAWHLTAGHTAPLLLGMILAGVPIAIAGGLLQHGLAALGLAGTLTGITLNSAAIFVQAAVVTSFMSLSYRFFTRHKPPLPTTA